MSMLKKALPLILLISLLSVAGCSLDSLNMGDTKVSVDKDTGNVKVQNDKGNLSVSGDNKLPEGYPESLFPLPAGASISSSMTGEAPNNAVGKTYVVSANCSDSKADLLKFYEGKLKDASNYKVQEFSTSTNITGSKDKYAFVVNVFDNDSSRTLTISLTEIKAK